MGQSHKSRSFRVSRGVPKRSVFGPVLFSLFINDLPASLPSSVSCNLYADDLVISSFFRLVLTAMETTKGALIPLIAVLSTGVLLSIQVNVRPP